MKSLIFAASLTLVCGCATVPVENTSAIIANSVPPTKALRAQIVSEARDFMLDPYSIRDAEISYVGMFSDGVQGVCVKANAKNAMGGYVGREALGLSIKNGTIISSVENHPLCFEPTLKWLPFQELEAL